MRQDQLGTCDVSALMLQDARHDLMLCKANTDVLRTLQVEFQPGGSTPDDCAKMCVKLEQARVDFVDLSGM